MMNQNYLQREKEKGQPVWLSCEFQAQSIREATGLQGRFYVSVGKQDRPEQCSPTELG